MIKRILFIVFTVLIATPVLSAPVSIMIDLSQQKMYVAVNNQPKYSWDISTARRGYRTPIGTYKPTRMYVEYYSKKYYNSPMPYSIFFYGGYAIHGTDAISQLGTPASHGCVRLHPDNAARLFSLVKNNGKQNTYIRVRN